MVKNSWDWLRSFAPQPNAVPRSERRRAVAGALLGLLLTALVTQLLTGSRGMGTLLVAPMGASAVLLFCVPASPLAQPWSVIGGNTISALIGVACAQLVSTPLLAAPLAGAIAIFAMFRLRCLHPPSGAVALTAVLGGPAVQAAGFTFALVPVCLNSSLIVLAALAFNNLTGRRYPHTQQSAMRNVHATGDPVPTARLGFTAEDLDAVLARYGQVLDVSRDDLEQILLETEANAYARRFGVITCGTIMSRDAVTIRADTTLAAAWQLLRRHRLHALPVLDAHGRVAGIVGQDDFIHHLGLDEYRTLRERIAALLGTLAIARPALVAEIMHAKVITVGVDHPISALVPAMSNRGLHHVPVVDHDGVFAGIVSNSDLLGALFEARLTQSS